MMKGDIIKLSQTGTFGGARGGGEFAIHKRSTNVNGDIVWNRLFCIEYNEYISFSEELVVGGISDRTVYGGVGGRVGSDGDPLSARTQFLYRGYVSGLLNTAVSGFTRNNAWANSMQEAVWYLEGEVNTITLPHTQTLLNYANSYTGPLLTNVFALNLFRSDVPATALAAFNPNNSTTWEAVKSYRRQDQLYQDQRYQDLYYGISLTGLNQVPEPASLALWLTASFLCSTFRIRCSKATNADRCNA